MKKRSTPFSKGANDKKALRSKILGYLNDHPSKAVNYKQLAKYLQITDHNSRNVIPLILNNLKELGLIEEIYTGKYMLRSKIGYVTGFIELNQRGEGTLISENVREKIFIPQSGLNLALDGDKVKVYLFARRKNNILEGEVVEIIERAKTSFVGVVELSKNFAFLVADSKNMPFDIFIPLSKLKGAANGQKAIAQITEWSQHAKNPFGEIIEILGDAGEPDTEINAILAEFDLPYRFPEEVNTDAETIPEKIGDQEINKR